MASLRSSNGCEVFRRVTVAPARAVQQFTNATWLRRNTNFQTSQWFSLRGHKQTLWAV
jgi:hypothetical protein